MERLQKFIAGCGVASRRYAESLIDSGRISVNGKIVRQQGITVDAIKDVVRFDGNIIKKAEEKVYIILYKPKGFISTVKDEHGRKTIMQLVADIPQRIFPVGRLDNNTEGLILLTNDGDLMQKLLHPKFKVEKVYSATIAGRLSSENLGRLRHGIMLKDGVTAPADVKIIKYDDSTNRSRIQLKIHEGRNRQVRRMFEATGNDVLTLKRKQFAGLDMKGLKRGKYRRLTEEELTQLITVITENNL
ncbi:23S rRNA pseudouridine2605 synthase [Pectinatus haikarae]|uniref:Pseudouridine synthase n=1 Tax=Pectinatus haikarae TaxID=349096 RepID=A0ABT9Y7E3_9FIRM|nr:pseudouridine synthase [Pectinatus haikarae]MDQ0203748.1 23S rRNA pseudouridine2605 synthase [Pectinatus haikarae]